jgi:hypothetical protein
VKGERTLEAVAGLGARQWIKMLPNEIHSAISSINKRDLLMPLSSH